ncbi:10102_t:CDS:10 [Diversispora eburnea]|uniref:10102_t:CDS:1 n=1 Tax=Diversispora eburnea TaxID=1213867 RepID=A0A9N9ATS0_9GLOM|nr:10102_t:CDS:10 [Diversispora eburnea]
MEPKNHSTIRSILKKEQEIRQQLKKVEERLEKAEKKLEAWEEGKYEGKKLKEWEIELMEGNLTDFAEGKVANEQYIQENKDLKYTIFLLELANTRNSVSLYRHVREHGDVQLWQIEEDIIPLRGAGSNVFNQYRDAPAQGLSEINVNQPFCKKVVSEINEIVNQIHGDDLLVVGDNGGQKEDEVFLDIIIGPVGFYSELTKNTPNLSKGLGWEIKNNLNEKAKADPPLTSIFYGCLTDGKLWQFVRIQLILNDINNLKVKFEESLNYEWSEHTASFIAGLLNHYHNDLSMRASGEKKESRNNDETYMYRNKSSISSESLLASFIEEGIYIRLNSGNYIHVQITSHLGTGRECIVFLAQVRDYGIKDAVLKIEVCKDTKISQVYREISALHALGDLPCVPKLLFEGYTTGGSLALLTDFAGQPLESWISDNDVAIRNVIQRNGHFYLIDFGLATLLQLHSDPCQAIIQDYSRLCQIIGIIKFGEKMSFSELIGKLKGELKSLVVFVEDVSRWKITDEGKWLEKFDAKVKHSYERSSRKALLEITENIKYFHELDLFPRGLHILNLSDSNVDHIIAGVLRAERNELCLWRSLHIEYYDFERWKADYDNWHPDVKEGGEIKKAHDLLYYEKIFNTSDYPYMKNSNYSGSTEYEKAMHFLEVGCDCDCSQMVPKEKFAELREAFQALSRSEQDIFFNGPAEGNEWWRNNCQLTS